MANVIDSKLINNLEILTDEGFADITHVHKTSPYHIVEVTTHSFCIKVADDHKLYAIGNIPIKVSNLKVGDKVMTINGLEVIKSISNKAKRVNMFSPTVDNVKSSYYSNGFQSENSTTVGIYALHYTLFNKDKTVAVLANKMQGAKEILTRVKGILEELPDFLKPGITEYNKTSITFENGCKIIAAATSPSAVRGLTINCITGDNKVTLKDNDNGAVFDITLENLVKELS
jgi:hypothetical protein